MPGKGFGVGVALVHGDFEMLDPLALQQGEHLLLREHPLIQILLVERIHVLAVTAQGVAAAALFDLDAAVRKPEGLQGFTEVAGRELGNPTADFGDFHEFRLLLRIGFGLGGFLCEIRVAVGVGYDRVEGDLAGPVEFDLGPVGSVLGEGPVRGFDLFEDPSDPLGEHGRIVGHAGTRGVVVHRIDPAALYEQFRVATVQLLVELVGAVVRGLALPRFVDLFQDFLGFVGEAHFAERGQGQLFRIKVVLDPVALPFRVGVDHGPAASQAAYDGVAVKIDFLVVQHLFKQLGAGDENALALALVVGLNQKLQAFRVHVLRRVKQGRLLILNALLQIAPID